MDNSMTYNPDDPAVVAAAEADRQRWHELTPDIVATLRRVFPFHRFGRPEDDAS